MFGNMKKILIGVALIGGIMSGSCCGSEEITITSLQNTSTSYIKCQSSYDMKNFIEDCKDSKSIFIKQTESTIAEATKTLIENTIDADNLESTDLSNDKKALLAALCRIATQQFISSFPDAVTYPAEILKKIAPTNYDIAVLLLESQCESNYLPKNTADWNIIGDAVYLLKNEKNGHTSKANNLLKQLKELKSNIYAPLLAKWSAKE